MTLCVVHRDLETSYKVSDRSSNLNFITIVLIFEGFTTWFEPKRPSIHLYHTWLCRYGCVLEYVTTYMYMRGS
jgi:hypothetical protein